jgi:hypothetical protein
MRIMSGPARLFLRHCYTACSPVILIPKGSVTDIDEYELQARVGSINAVALPIAIFMKTRPRGCCDCILFPVTSVRDLGLQICDGIVRQTTASTRENTTTALFFGLPSSSSHRTQGLGVLE